MSTGTPNPKLRIDDTSVNGTTTKIANNQATNNGIQTANVQGSNTDANALQTAVGSMGTINSNTDSTKLSPMQTTQTQAVPPLDETSAWQQNYNQDIATNNLSRSSRRYGTTKQSTKQCGFNIKETNSKRRWCTSS